MVRVLIAAAILAGLWIAAVVLADYRRQSRLRGQRRGYSEADFVRYFGDSGIDADVSRTVLRRMQRYMLPSGVLVHPTDDLHAVYRIDNEELNELVEDLAKEVGRDFRRPEQPDSGDPVNTVEDLVKYLDSLPIVPQAATD